MWLGQCCTCPDEDLGECLLRLTCAMADAAHAPLEISMDKNCDQPGVWRCDADRLVQVLLGLIVGCAVLWFLMWLCLIYRAKSHFYGLPYADYKVPNLFLRLQVRPCQHLQPFTMRFCGD